MSGQFGNQKDNDGMQKAKGVKTTVIIRKRMRCNKLTKVFHCKLRFAPNREETMTLANKLPLMEYLYQLERAIEVRDNVEKTFVRTKPNLLKTLPFYPFAKSSSKNSESKNVSIKGVISRGLNHNLFLVGQFCDADLEVAFRKSTCFVRDLQGNDLLTDTPCYSKKKGLEHQTSTHRTPGKERRYSKDGTHLVRLGEHLALSLSSIYHFGLEALESIHIKFDEIKEIVLINSSDLAPTTTRAVVKFSSRLVLKDKRRQGKNIMKTLTPCPKTNVVLKQEGQIIQQGLEFSLVLYLKEYYNPSTRSNCRRQLCPDLKCVCRALVDVKQQFLMGPLKEEDYVAQQKDFGFEPKAFSDDDHSNACYSEKHSAGDTVYW
ncbi:hypothetical protein Tco_1577192 [Tanacetum coccineum]